MCRIRSALFGLSVLLLLSDAAYAAQPSIQIPDVNSAMNSASLPVNWQQNSINWSQLQNIFTSNPAFQRFNIQFPGGFTWDVNEATLMQFFSSYSEQAASKGLSTSPSAVAFSPLTNKASVVGGKVMLPINAAIDGTEQQIQGLMDQLTYEKYHLADSLPDWLKKIISAICIGFGILYDFAVEQLRKLF